MINFVDRFNPWAVLDLAQGRFGRVWAVLDLAVGSFGHIKNLWAVLVGAVLVHGPFWYRPLHTQASGDGAFQRRSPGRGSGDEVPRSWWSSCYIIKIAFVM